MTVHKTADRVVAEVLIENLPDLLEVREGRRSPEQVRRVIAPDAVIDPRIASMELPAPLIRELGLTPMTAWGGKIRYWPVQLTLLGRDCPMDVTEAADGEPIRLGVVVLTALDLVMDTGRGCVTTNPAHGGEQILELFWCSGR
jgi:hypothetical protein